MRGLVGRWRSDTFIINATVFYILDIGRACGSEYNSYIYRIDDLSPFMRKPVNAICEQKMRRLACASAQSDRSLTGEFVVHCPDSILPLLTVAEIQDTT